MLITVLIAAGGIVFVAAVLTWVVRRAGAADDRLGTISTQWISEHRSHEREHVDRRLFELSALSLHGAPDIPSRALRLSTKHALGQGQRFRRGRRPSRDAAITMKPQR